ncbi:MAG: LuxR C-terminal-related transcriptional regulator [Coriobacteriales bacterium]|nr:LuxR C-terminal-related transcriptional regulator [Coriobacteriales bacterium]
MQGLKYLEIEHSCSLSSGTVKTHVSNLYKKLNVHSRKEMRDLYNRYRSKD